MDNTTLNILHVLINFAQGWPLGIVGAVIFFILLGKFIAGLFKKFLLAIIIFIVIAFIVGGNSFESFALGKAYQQAVTQINHTLTKPIISLSGD